MSTLHDDPINEVLRDVAYEIEAELICCPDDDPCGASICHWAKACRRIVLSHIRPTNSTP